MDAADKISSLFKELEESTRMQCCRCSYRIRINDDPVYDDIGVFCSTECLSRYKDDHHYECHQCGLQVYDDMIESGDCVFCSQVCFEDFFSEDDK